MYYDSQKYLLFDDPGQKSLPRLRFLLGLDATCNVSAAIRSSWYWQTELADEEQGQEAEQDSRTPPRQCEKNVHAGGKVLVLLYTMCFFCKQIHFSSSELPISLFLGY